MPDQIDGLRERWEALLRDIAKPEERRAQFDALIARYREPHRRYHTLDHIAECLQLLDEHRHLVRDPRRVELAVWFHDAVYDPTRPDNEARSADVADEALALLGADDATRDEVRRLVLLTVHQQPPGTDDPDGQLMVDIDLASLGVAPEVFDANGENLRNEFAHLDRVAYERGRDAMLQRMLDRPRIYRTEAFALRFEDAARANLRRTLSGETEGNPRRRQPKAL